MSKTGKWAQQIIARQCEDGSWGLFHSMRSDDQKPITTEMALRRLERLGFDGHDACIQRAIAYMDDCLAGRNAIPDPREKVLDWDVFTELMLSTWIRRFTDANERANSVAKKWAAVVTRAFVGGAYDPNTYAAAWRDVIHPAGGRMIGVAQFYMVSILRGELDARTENALVRMLLAHPDGVYYIYDRCLATLPTDFHSKTASRYLAAIELLADYPHARAQLQFVADWLRAQANEKGRWDMGAQAKDGVYFPLSDDWRRAQTRENDCTQRVTRLIEKLNS